ncbi:MAG: TPM domain-containing protein, partial [Dehalococcoidia bacterium]|nr:TPM domain-containing protein [Dehalococcoidia bacterium]
MAGIPILAALLILACTPSVSAQSQDRLLVVDGAGLFGERLDDVEAAAESLQSRGADLRVRTVFTCGPSGNLDQYEADLESNSPSWLGADGYRKNNLIVILICLEGGGQTGLFYGSYWESALGSTWHSIQADVMNPRFRDGDYAGGTVAGLEEIQRHIQSNGADGGSGGGSSAAGLFLAVVIVAAALTALLLYTSHRKSQARRAGLRQKALLAKQAAAAGINELIEVLQMLHIKVNVTGEKVAIEEAGELRSALSEARRLVDVSSMRYSELSHSAGDPDNPKLGEAELAAIEPEYTTILENLRQARDSVKRVEGAVATVLGLIDAFPGKVLEVESAISRVVG